MNFNWNSITSLICDWISCFADIVSEVIKYLGLLGSFILIIVSIRYLFSNKKRINALSEMKLADFEKNGKYNPLLFIEFSNAKELLRYFIYGIKWKQRIVDEFNRMYCNNNMLKEYSQSFLKTYQICSESSLKEIKEVLKEHVSYFSNKKFFEKTLRKFPDYRYFLRGLRANYQSLLNDQLQKCDIMESNIVLIKSSAGNGKTALVCNITELLLKLKRRVIFINSRDIVIFSEKSFKEYLINHLNLFPLLMKFKDLIYALFFKCFSTYIVIDAINENDEKDFPRQLFSELDELASKGVKIILTCREEYFEQRFSKFVNNMSNKPYILKINGWHRDNRANEKLLERYCKAYNVTKPLPFISDQLFSASLLLVRLYFEVNKGKKSQDISLYRYEIYGKYVKYLKNKYDDEKVYYLIDSIAKLMIDNQIYNEISLTAISDDEQVKNFIRTISDENLLTARKIKENENTIAELNEEVIYFPFDELRDYCIARYLTIRYGELEKQDKSTAKNNLYDFLSTLEIGFSSPLEGILHYLYLHFKSLSRNDICEELLKKGFYDYYCMNWGRLFDNLALNVIFDSEQTLEDYELKYIAGILTKGTQDTHRLFRYLFYKEKNGDEGQLSILLEILYLYTDFSDLEKALSCYNADRDDNYSYFYENEHQGECLEMLLSALENQKCLDCIEYLVVVALVIKDFYKIQSLVPLYSDYNNILQKIITKSRCDALKHKAKSVLNVNEDISRPYSDEELTKSIKEDLEYYERNSFY